ncbi:hypothetical protein QOT17_012700 [Balamuthia mandrillaris]
MSSPAKSVQTFLSLQPFVGYFATITLKMQDPLEEPRSLWEHLFHSPARPSRPSTYMDRLTEVKYYVILQLLEGPLVGVVSSIFLDMASTPQGDEINDNNGSRERHSGRRRRGRPQQLHTLKGMLVARSLATVGCSLLSHPFSIIHRYFLIKGTLPEATMRANLDFAYIRYRNSVGVHAADNLLSFLLNEGVLWLCRRFILPLIAPRRQEAEQQNQPLTPFPLKAELRKAEQVRQLNINARNILLRTCSLFITRALLFPLSSIRTRLELYGCSNTILQVAATTGPNASGEAAGGFYECTRSMWLEGPSSFYRGFSSLLVSGAVQIAFMGIVYSAIRGLIRMDMLMDDDDGEDGYSTYSSQPHANHRHHPHPHLYQQ